MKTMISMIMMVAMAGFVTDARGAEYFENFNAGLYLRNTPENFDDLHRCYDYYARQGIPFDFDSGFEEHAAALANEGWAARFRVERQHLKMGTSRLYDGWPCED